MLYLTGSFWLSTLPSSSAGCLPDIIATVRHKIVRLRAYAFAANRKHEGSSRSALGMRVSVGDPSNILASFLARLACIAAETCNLSAVYSRRAHLEL